MKTQEYLAFLHLAKFNVTTPAADLGAVNRLLADEVKALSLKVEQLQHQLHGANRHRFVSGAFAPPSGFSRDVRFRA